MIATEDITLGLLAGGRASRLGGIDKAWLVRGGEPQVLRWHRRFAHEVAATLVSANRDPARYVRAGLEVVGDRMPGPAGPIAGLDALLHRCHTPWLLTLPVDLVGLNECLLQTLVSAVDADGAVAHDEDGAQPLVALWRVAAACDAVGQQAADHDHSVQRLQQSLRMTMVHFAGVRFGNLNTPGDLRVAGIEWP